jgi:hypothetical protein
MSEPMDSTASPPRPPGTDLLQETAKDLTNGICAAYAAYNNGNNLQPTLPGYKNFNLIWVHEADPNVFPWSLTGAQGEVAATAAAKTQTRIARQPAAYASRPGAPPAPCTGPTPIGTPSAGYQLFGFTATSNDNKINILVLRGTVTMQEAGYDLFGWGNNTQCLLPSQSSNQQAYGLVNSYLYAFYAYGDVVWTSLATSCMNAIEATNQQNPNVYWWMGSHSLGGAMLSLAALDAVVSNLISPQKLIAMTFGSLHVGDGSFAQAYTAQVPWSYRVANLCDFVPSMVSLEPVIPQDPYVHVGEPGTFVWQTWDDWGNHSLANIYMPMVWNDSYWKLIKWGARHYPQ